MSTEHNDCINLIEITILNINNKHNYVIFYKSSHTDNTIHNSSLNPCQVKMAGYNWIIIFFNYNNSSLISSLKLSWSHFIIPYSFYSLSNDVTIFKFSENNHKMLMNHFTSLQEQKLFFSLFDSKNNSLK